MSDVQIAILGVAIQQSLALHKVTNAVGLPLVNGVSSLLVGALTSGTGRCVCVAVEVDAAQKQHGEMNVEIETVTAPCEGCS